MIEKRDFSSLGHVDHGWLNARHHFSFGSYHDPARMGWGNVRVWNDDEIAPKSGFPTHPHRDMEIITYVRKGAITHRDSVGNEGRTAAGDVQVMSAGTGIQHSEFNLEDETTKLFQIWIIPREAGGTPRWDARQFPKQTRNGQLEILASGYADEIAAGALEIRADARLSGATLQSGQTLTHQLADDASGYLVVSTGGLTIGGVTLHERDAATIEAGSLVTIEATEASEFLIAETVIR